MSQTWLVGDSARDAVDTGILPATSSFETDGVIQITVYSDYQCPACSHYHSLLKRLSDELGEAVSIHYRHLPLQNLHPLANLAARAAEAARAHGAFEQMHGLLFQRRDEWIDQTPKDCARLFVSYAESIQLDPDEFSRSLTSDAVSERVRSDAKVAADAGITSTPTLIVEGQHIPRNPRHYEALRSLVLSHLRRTDEVHAQD